MFWGTSFPRQKNFEVCYQLQAGENLVNKDDRVTKQIGTLSIDTARDDDDELRREGTGSRTSFAAGKFES